MKLKITKPICFFDLETTGTNPAKDRIVSIAVVKFMPDGTNTPKYSLINPEMPIPKEATEVHKITDEMVTNAPVFRRVAKSLAALMADSDLGGFGILKFDIPMISEEMNRCGIEFPVEGQKFVDALSIFHKKEERTLAAAHKFYVGEEMKEAHNALADTSASWDVFIKQLNRYPELAEMESIDQVAAFCKKDNTIDFAGCFIKDEQDNYRVNFGKHKGELVKDLFTKNKKYYDWMIEKGEFTSNTISVAKKLYNWANNIKE